MSNNDIDNKKKEIEAVLQDLLKKKSQLALEGLAYKALQGRFLCASMAEFIGYPDIAKCHHDLDEKIEDALSKVDKEMKLFLAVFGARGFYKSTVFARSYIVKRIVQNPLIKILLFASKRDLASDQLSPIKRIFENNQNIKMYYGDFQGTSVWNNMELLVKPAEKQENPDNVFTLETGGVDTNIAGKHYDLIVVDDPIGKDNVDNSKYLEQLTKTFPLLMPLLNPGGELRLCAMRWGERDWYDSEIIQKRKKSFNIFILSDVKRDEDGNPLDKDGAKVKEDSPFRIPTFPEKYPLKSLDRIRTEELFEYLYSCHMANYPKRSTFKLMDYNDLIKIEKETYKAMIEDIVLGKTPRGQLRVIIDSQSTVSDQANYTGITFWNYDTKNFYMFDVYKLKMLFNDLADFICPIIIKYNIPIVHYEKSGASGNLVYALRKGFNDLGRPDIVLEDVSHKGEDKKIRIAAMQPYVTNHRVYILPEKFEITEKNGNPADILKFLQIEMDLFPQDGTNIPDDIIDTWGFTPELFGLEVEFYDPNMVERKLTHKEAQEETDKERFKCTDIDKLDAYAGKDGFISDKEGVIFL